MLELIQAVLKGPNELRRLRNEALDAEGPHIQGVTIKPGSPPRTIAQSLSELATNPEARTLANAAALMEEGGRTFAKRQDMPLSGPVGPDLVRRAVQQAAAGFNDKIGNLLYLPSDLENHIVRSTMGVMGIQRDPTPSPHESFNRTFVDPGGPPVGMMEKSLRRGGEAVGTALPIFAGGAGLASALAPAAALTSTAAPAAGGTAAVLRSRGLDWLAANPVIKAITGGGGKPHGPRTLLDWLAANPSTAIETGTHGAFTAGGTSQRALAAAQQAGFIDQGPPYGNEVTQ
jgi:hypothetical protein